jgi:ABC-type transport system involved in multi-copper enzyme maturation permease subunit
MNAAVCRPRLDLLVRGELRKLSRQRANWLLVGLAVVFAAVAGLVLSTSSGIWHAETAYRNTVQTNPSYWLHGIVVVGGMIIRVVEGALLLFASARLVGMEYSSGTIRVVLARGVGRVRLLTAKLAALALFSLAITTVLVVLAAAFGVVMVGAQGGSLPHVLSALPAGEWHDVWIHVLTILLSAGVCVLIGAAGAALGRSLPLAMIVAVGFFPLDNFVAGDRSFNVYQLGTNLNGLNETLGHMRESIFSRPAVAVDATHSLVVIGVFCVAFLLAAFIPTWRRDVLE